MVKAKAARIHEFALKRCPFCGSASEYIYTDLHLSKWKHRIECASTTCGASGPVEGTKSGAIEAWNRRIEKKGNNNAIHP